MQNGKASSPLTSAQRWGVRVFVGAVVLTAVLIVLGIAGVPWPRWLLALAAIL